jgi:hypothetical protein
VAASRRGVDQGVLADQVEQVLEVAGKAAAVHRRGHHQQVGLFHQAQLLFDGVGQFAAPQGTAQWAGDVAQFDQVRLDVQVFGQFGEDRSVRARVREGREVPPDRATTFSGVLMGRSPVLVERGLCLSNRRAGFNVVINQHVSALASLRRCCRAGVSC